MEQENTQEVDSVLAIPKCTCQSCPEEGQSIRKCCNLEQKLLDIRKGKSLNIKEI